MPNKILKPGQSRLILEAQLKAVVLRSMLANKNYKFIWSKALAVFHPACEAYRIQMRMMRIPRKLAVARLRKAISAAPIIPQNQPQEMQINTCIKCGLVSINSHCAKHGR